jgi:hypothetical protein
MPGLLISPWTHGQRPFKQCISNFNMCKKYLANGKADSWASCPRDSESDQDENSLCSLQCCIFNKALRWHCLSQEWTLNTPALQSCPNWTYWPSLSIKCLSKDLASQKSKDRNQDSHAGEITQKMGFSSESCILRNPLDAGIYPYIYNLGASCWHWSCALNSR